MSGTGRLVRLAETGRASIGFTLDGEAMTGLAGDTVLTAVLHGRKALREGEFDGSARAGFCLMGACQDCWLWQEDGARLRACSTMLREGMRLRSAAPDWVVQR